MCASAICNSTLNDTKTAFYFWMLACNGKSETLFHDHDVIQCSVIQCSCVFRAFVCLSCSCAFANTPKYSQVKAAGGVIVRKEWVMDCHKTKQKISFKRWACTSPFCSGCIRAVLNPHPNAKTLHLNLKCVSGSLICGTREYAVDYSS